MVEFADWTLLRSFLAVMRRGSLSGAARATGLAQPTVGRHIDELERGLGATLFTRSPAGLIPTEAAHSIVVHAEGMEMAFASLVRVARAGGDAEKPRGTVRDSASEIMGTNVLPPLLAELRFRFADIVIELVLNNRTDDLLRRDADLAVRMVRPTQDGLVGRKIGEIVLALYAHRRYVEAFGMPQNLRELPGYHIVGFDRDDHSARAVAGGRLPIDRELFSFRSDSDVAQLFAMRAGLGIGLVQKAIAAGDPDLVPVLAGEIAVPLACWLVVHEDQRDSPPVRAVFDGLAEGLTRWVSAAR
jgi:DNA-binding transcriptional LysR family regulator